MPDFSDLDWKTIITMLGTLAGFFGAGAAIKKVRAGLETARKIGRDAAAAAIAVLGKAGITVDQARLQAWLMDKIDDLLDHAGLLLTDKLRKEALATAKVEAGRLALLHELDELRHAAGALDIDKIFADATARGRARVAR